MSGISLHIHQSYSSTSSKVEAISLRGSSLDAGELHRQLYIIAKIKKDSVRSLSASRMRCIERKRRNAF
jgi:hypothetical protein